MTLSPLEQICLDYLSDKMEVTSTMLGRGINPHSKNPTGLGAAALGRLRRKGFVMRLPELNAWRLTKAGRELVSQSNVDHTEGK